MLEMIGRTLRPRGCADARGHDRPEFITFTGADDKTPIKGMCELSAQYPIEWGILFSPTKQGFGRYPSMGFVMELLANDRLAFAAHLCGEHIGDLLNNGETALDGVMRLGFGRAQINTADSTADPRVVGLWANRVGVDPILPCRDSFPDDGRVAWVFDTSKGRGISPESWPEPISRLHGYAGGLNPGNVVQAVQVIGSRAKVYWIDMESGVRDE